MAFRYPWGHRWLFTCNYISDNNQAPTVLCLFQDGVSHFGLPEHVRSDHGGENVDVWRYMIATHNLDYSYVVTGSSVHNERVERLWLDVHRRIASGFADTFRSLEREWLSRHFK